MKRSRNPFESHKRRLKTHVSATTNKTYTHANLVTGKHDLPDDVWVAIFRFLSIPDVTRLAVTCKKLHWLTSTRQKEVWHRTPFFARMCPLVIIDTDLRGFWKNVYENMAVFDQYPLAPWQALLTTGWFDNGKFIEANKSDFMLSWIQKNISAMALESRDRNSEAIIGRFLPLLGKRFKEAETFFSRASPRLAFDAALFLKICKKFIEVCCGAFENALIKIDNENVIAYTAMAKKTRRVRFTWTVHKLTDTVGRLQKTEVGFCVHPDGLVNVGKLLCVGVISREPLMCRLRDLYFLVVDVACAEVPSCHQALDRLRAICL